MNGIEKVTDRIIADARKEALNIINRAEAEAGRMAQGFQQMAQSEYDELVAEGAEVARQHEERIVSNARMDMSRELLGIKQEMVTETLARALDMLSKLPEGDYISLLSRLAAKASETGREELILSEADCRRYGSQIVSAANSALADAGRPAGLTLSAETRSMTGGVILKNDDIEVNCSLESLVYSRRDEFATIASGTLFG